MSVGHSRRTSRSRSPSASGCADFGKHLEQAHLEPVLGLAGALADEDDTVALLHDRGRSHPVQRLVAAGVVVHEEGAVVLEHEQARRLRQDGRQPAGVGDLAAGDEEAHGERTVLSDSDRIGAFTDAANRVRCEGPGDEGGAR
jgi:hypothetical protein